MSTWSDVPRNTSGGQVSPFPYVELEAPQKASLDSEAFGEKPQSCTQPAQSVISVDEQLARAEAAGYERGRQETAAEANLALETALARERAQVKETLCQFTTEKREYFHHVEAEIIQLSLAIARRVLGHEASVDCLLLAGTVRAAIERLSRSSKVTVVVHPSTSIRWREALSDCQNELEFAEDGSLSPEACILRCPVGTTEIALDQQIKEVERSFSDLLACRPGAEVRVQ